MNSAGRVSTGNREADMILGGGFLANSINVIETYSSDSHTFAPVTSLSKSKNAFFRGVLMVQLIGGH